MPPYMPSATSTQKVRTDDDDEDDEANAELLRKIEAEVKDRRDIEKKEKSAAIDAVKRSEESEVWTEVTARNAGKSVVATSIRGKKIPLLEVYLNPFKTLAATDASDNDVSKGPPIIDEPAGDLLERMNRRLAEACAAPSASPSPSLSGISSIRATGATNATPSSLSNSDWIWTVLSTHHLRRQA